MNQKAFKGHLKAAAFFIVFAIVQFSFFWGLCHPFPGERLYQRKARIKASNAPVAAIIGEEGLDLAKRANEAPK